MIQIDMEMPKNCCDCPFNNEAFLCVAMPEARYDETTGVGYISNPKDPCDDEWFNKQYAGRAEWCPLKEVKAEEPKHENLNIPERCGVCVSMRTITGPYGLWQYCGSPTKLSDPLQDIHAFEVSPFGRPEWCPMVKTQKALDELPPEKREKADMMMRGLKAMFGIKDEG